MISFVIATHNMGKFLPYCISSILNSKIGTWAGTSVEIIVYDDGSTDNTREIMASYNGFLYIKYYRGESPSGTGEAFNKAVSYAKNDIIFLMCADDVIVGDGYIDFIIDTMHTFPTTAHISRKYFQFLDGDHDLAPVRHWKTNNILELANNPSGLVFRKSILEKHNIRFTNKMFIETAQPVREILDLGYTTFIFQDHPSIAVRIHQSTSRNKDYWKRMMTQSPILAWHSIGCKSILTDFTSLIQIRNFYKYSAVVQEIINFIKVRPLNLIHPYFWLFSIVVLVTPRSLLLLLTEIYRKARSCVNVGNHHSHSRL